MSPCVRERDKNEFVRFCMRADRQAQYSSLVANGPSNSNAYKLIDPARAELLPTFPKNLERLTRRDTAWWGKNFDSANEKFQEWLLNA